jgi:hypothetical protein
MLGLFAAMNDRTKQVAVGPPQTSQENRVPLITLAFVLRNGRVLRRLATTTSIPREARNRLLRRMVPASITTKATGVCARKLRNVGSLFVQRALLQDLPAAVEHANRVSLVTKIKTNGCRFL